MPVPAAAVRDTRTAAPAQPRPRAILILPKKGVKKEGDTKAVNFVAVAK